MSDWRVKNLISDFKESKKGILLLIAIHIFMTFLLLGFSTFPILSNPRIYILCITIFVLTISAYYSWDDFSLSVVIVILYLLLVGCEYYFSGNPRLIENCSNKLSKGVLFQIVLALAPYLYLPLRIWLSIYLIHIIYLRKQLYKKGIFSLN